MAILQPVYGSSSNFSTTNFASLASDTNLLAGWQSVFIDNTANLSDEEFVSAQFTIGASAPTANRTIEVWIYAALTDTPTYPDTITGAQSLVTLTSTNVKYAALALGTIITVDATASRTYYMNPFSVSSLYGGSVPKRWGVFVVQNTGVALSATQVVTRTPLQYQSV